jgi:vitamin B12 transporter
MKIERPLIAFLTMLPLPALAQPVSPAALPELVVTATGVETPQDQLAASVTVITREDIARNQYQTMVDVLKAVPGLNIVQSGGPGKQTSVFMRGTNSNHVLVLIDGMNASDPSTPNGSFNFAHLLAAAIDRVEVVRGPLSSLYGSDAIGGVINVTTRKGAGPASGAASIQGGTFRTDAEAANIQGGQGMVNYNFSVDRFYTQSISVTPNWLRGGRPYERDGYTNHGYNARVGIDPTENFGLTLISRYINSYTAYDGVPEDPNSREKTNQWYNRLQGDLVSLGGRWTNTVGAAYVRIDRTDLDDRSAYIAQPSRNNNLGERLRVDWQSKFQVTQNATVTGGADTTQDRFRSQTQLSPGPYSTISADDRLSGAYLNGNLSFIDRIFLTLGGRYDDQSRFGSHGTWRGSALYRHIETDTEVHASYGTAFKAPTLYQLFSRSAFFVGNPNLKPEESKGWEAGIRQGVLGDRLSVGATWFHNDITNLIQSNATFTSYVNVGKARTQGVEAFVAAAILPNLAARLDYTYTDAHDEMSNLWLLRRPWNKVSVAVDWKPVPDVDLGLQVIYDGARADINAQTFGRITPGGYTLVNLTGAWAVTPTWQVFGRMQNAFAKNYQNPNGFQQPGFGAFGGVKATF